MRVSKIVSVSVVILLISVLFAGVATVPAALSPAAAQSSNVQSYPGPFVGSKNSDVYHYPWCSYVNNIKLENRVTFATACDAYAAGYRPCLVCKPPQCGSPTPTPTPTPTPMPPTSTQLTLTASTITPTVGQTVTFTVNLQADSTGLSKSVKISHTANEQTWSDGTHTTPYSFNQAYGSAGPRVYTVEFAGDSQYAASTGTIKVNVQPAASKTATTTTITASNPNPTVGSGVTLTVTVYKAGTTTVLTNKQVTVTHTYPSGTSPGKDGVFDTGSTGTTTFSATYGTPGQRVYTATFAGDSTYASSTGTVTVNVGGKTPTTTSITASNPNPAVGSAVTITITVKAGSTVLTNKQVTVTHTYPSGTSPGKDGVFDTGSTGTKTFSATYGTPGQRVYTAVFAGDSQYAASSGTVTMNVGKSSTTTTITASNTNPPVGQTVIFSVTVKAGTTKLTNTDVRVSHTYPTATGVATGYDGPDNGWFNTGSSGVVMFSVTYGSAGQRVYHVEFAGDSSYGASSGTVTVNVGTSPTTPTTATITASNMNPPVGSGVTLTVTVYKAGTTEKLLNKQVTVTHTYPSSTTPGNDGVFDTGSSGVISFLSGTYGSTGQWVYTAAFAGDSQYGASSGTVTVNVGTTPTTLAITADDTNPVANEWNLITITLKAGSTGLSKPVKLVLTENGVEKSNGTITTDNGIYQYTSIVGIGGRWVYHAEFAGDSQYGASSDSVTVNVQPRTTTATITASTTTPTIGESVTFTVNLDAHLSVPGTWLLNKPVTIWHTTPDGTRVEDGTFNTVSGVYTFTQAFGSTGERVYHVEFAGDSEYAASSGTMTVNVQLS